MARAKQKRRTREASREQIVQVAIDLFAKHGFHETTFQHIADRCGMSQTTVLYHFTSKRDLVREVLNEILRCNHDIVTSAIGQLPAGRKALWTHFQANLQWAVLEPKQAEVVLLLYYLSSCDRSFSSLYAKVRLNARDRIAIHLKAMGHTNSVDSLSTLLHDLLLGSIVNHLSCLKSNVAQPTPELSWKIVFDSVLGKDPSA